MTGNEFFRTVIEEILGQFAREMLVVRAGANDQQLRQEPQVWAFVPERSLMAKR